jgi:PPE-repeat protein
MDFGALPPEINSGLMYSGPGSSTILGAAAAWNGLASELQSAAASYETVIANLTSGTWQGPSAAAMAAAAAPYVAWMNATASQAEQAASQAMSAAGAYHVAFAMTVPPAVIAANRAQLLMLVATNFFGQNTPAISVNEAEYAEFWAQDATAMYGYADNAAAASVFTPFASPPPTTNAAGLANQTAAAAQATGTSQTSSITQTITNALQSLTSPAASTTTPSNSLLTDLLNALGLTSTSGTATTGTTTTSLLGGTIDTGSLEESLLAEYGDLPGFFGIMMGSNAIAPMLYTSISQAMTAVPAAAAGGAASAAGAAGGAAAAAGNALGPALGGGAWGGMGQAAGLGPLSVPQNWLWSAAKPLEMVAPMGTPIFMPEAPVGAAGGSPMLLGGLPRAAGVGAAAGAGAAAVKFGSRSKVMARPPAAGYPAEEAARVEPAANGAISNGHAPAGYRPAIVYVPANGHVPSTNN